MSSRSVTPQRRPREDDDFETADFEDDASQHGNKRPRLDQERNGSEEEYPLLPDSFRRSPKGKGRARDALTSRAQQEHHPGSIVRVTLTNFVTYTKAEFRPGPNLNMVIGPNGTGKSTLVCAICIGLGWSTSHLGRAKDITEFVKHGGKSATIEIELKADPERHDQNPVITHRINRDGNAKSGPGKSVYMIDGKKSNNKAVQDLARSFSIQVDNLCQFLPQDRVVEFAALSPVDLLRETQRAAAAEHMSQWHEQLKTMGKDQRKGLEEQQSVIDDLKSKEDRQKSQEDLVNRLRERSELQQKVKSLEKLRPFAEYQGIIDEHKQVWQKKKDMEKRVRHLRAKMQPNTDKIQSKVDYLDRLVAVVEARQRLLGRMEQEAQKKQATCEQTSKDIEQCAQELGAEKRSGKDARETIKRYQGLVRDTERALKNPPAKFDPVKMNEEIRAKTHQLRTNGSARDDARNSFENLRVQKEQRATIIQDLMRKEADLQSQAGRQKSRLFGISQDTAKAWEWIEANQDKFASEVYGPPLVTCSVKDSNNTSAVETALGQSELLAITVTSQQDFNMLQRELYTNQKLSSINLRTSLRKLESWQPPCDKAELRRLGGEAWVLDLIEGPDDVLSMLCDNKSIHSLGFARNDLDGQQWDRLQASVVTNFITMKTSYTIIRRKEYGDAGTSTRSTQVKPARWLTDAPVDTQQEQEHNESVTRAKGEMNLIQQEQVGITARLRTLEEEYNRLKAEKAEIEADKAAKQEQQAKFNGLSAKLEYYKSKIADAEATVREQSARLMAIVEKQDKLCLEKGQQALDFARAVDQLRALHQQVLEAQIMRIEAQSDKEQLEASNAEERQELEAKQAEAAELLAQERGLKQQGRALARRLEELEQGHLNEDEKALYQGFLDEGNFQPEKLGMDIQSVQATLDMLHGGNENVIREFEQRAQRIEELRQKRDSLEQKLGDLSNNITEIREQWEPELDRVVRQISEAFSENFRKIDCAGEVAVHKDDDFEQWAIQIKVKFRENEPLSILDSHRQSGGERAVSTIFYLMALQSLARAPFRVVDEINQGMDPRNERLVHSRMVQIACAEHTSQYFLITPKLLNNLTYHPHMKVHCIASGEYMPEDPQKLNFEMLAQKALAVRAAQ